MRPFSILVLDFLPRTGYVNDILLQKGDDDYDKRNWDARNVIQGNHRPTTILFCSTPLYIVVQGLFFYLFINERNRKYEEHHAQKNR